MPAKKKKVTKTSRSRKTPQHPKHFLKVYWPYIPLLALVLAGLLFGTNAPISYRPHQPATLAYATEMSISGLLDATNAQRASSGLSPLTLNSQLNNSALAKANDMIERNYWAHNTPDGQEPWIFFDAAGYNYTKAGENLAYGFSSSNETVIGWMNSPSHRANILDADYTEVGFGFVNGENFVDTGNETVVVAHYATPPTTAAADVVPMPAPVAEPQALPASTSQPAPPMEDVSDEIPEEVLNPVEQEVLTPVGDDRYNQPVSTATDVPNDKPSQNITLLQKLTGGSAAWSASVVSMIAMTVVGLWLVKHGLLVKKYLHQGEDFVAHHPLLDLFVVVVTAIAVYLSQTTGVVL